MEELNKNQIVLLVLFVSFVTSIATGIVTVTLMDQSPKGVTQNISNVVERTIERVVSNNIVGNSKSEVVPVMVTEEESIIKVINGATPAVVKISRFDGNTLTNTGTGFLVNNQIDIVTPSSVVTDKNATYFALFSTGQKATLRLAAGDASSTLFALFRVQSVEEKKKELITNPFKKDEPVSSQLLKPIKFAANDTTLGQTVIGIADTNAVSVGIVSGFTQDIASTTLKLIRTNAANSDNAGGPILNIRGEVIGMSSAQGLAWPAGIVRDFVDSVK
ncbi:MAG: trypsin-like peptidase domain-containing protein [bacterium]